jgi:site-specific DNA-methyltransferase (cytosine-N4-specific)
MKEEAVVEKIVTLPKGPIKGFKTGLGKCYLMDTEKFLASNSSRALHGKVDLIFTSPPFPLVSEKAYGNLQGEEYLEWMVEIFQGLAPLLSDTGSVVIEIGNTWNKGMPTMSTLPLKTLISIAEKCDFEICQQFVWQNSARLPGPATWVNIRRIRIKDSHTHVWWFSKTPFPKADNRRILTPYSPAMEKLIATKKFNSGRRPSEHKISKTAFATNNEGAIPGSTFVIGNTGVDKNYVSWCKENNISAHPARMPQKLAETFIEFLTEPGDLVLDPFGGSNTTAAAAESMKRRWISIERDSEYVKGSIGRFVGAKGLRIE